jgi:hypothetical protein
MLAPTNPRTLDLLDFADFMEQLTPELYDQITWGYYPAYDCQTPACICGWYARSHGIDQDKVAAAMGLNHRQEELLFRATGARTKDENGSLRTSTTQAARVIRHLALTGEVNWEKANA